MSWTWRNSSTVRLDACRERLARLSGNAGPEDVMAIFCREPIRLRAHGNCRRERTVGAVVMVPQDATICLRRGDPETATTQAFTLHA